MVIKDPRIKEFTAGLGSATISIFCTFPVTKLIYRQLLDKASLRSSILKMKNEGLKNAYRGIFPPLFQRSAEISIMFGVYKTAELALHPLKLPPYDEKVASSIISGLVESVLTPMERVELLLIDSKNHNRFKNSLHAAIILNRDYGLKEFFRGYTAILARDICHNTFFFLGKDEMYGYIGRHKNEHHWGNGDFVVGSMLGLTMTITFYPIKVVKAEMQKQLGGKFEPIWTHTVNIYQHGGRGIRNFYRGVILNGLRSMMSWGITNCLDCANIRKPLLEHLEKIIRDKEEWEVMPNFILLQSDA